MTDKTAMQALADEMEAEAADARQRGAAAGLAQQSSLYSWATAREHFARRIRYAAAIDAMRAAEQMAALQRDLASFGLVLCEKVPGGCRIAGPDAAGDLFVARLEIGDAVVVGSAS